MNVAVRTVRADVAAVHGLDVDDVGDEAEIWVIEPTRPAIVLGSSQRSPAAVIDEAACRATGVEIVRRRSGGGIVLVQPGAMAWLDLIVPAGHPAADDDVPRSMATAGQWLAGAVAAAAAGVGVAIGPLAVVPSGAPAPPAAICFGGLAPGEVTRAGRKLVGLSARRTRGAARIQAMAHRVQDPELLSRLVVPALRPAVARATAGTATLPAAITTAAVVEHLRRALA